MTDINNQVAYWDAVAWEKEFMHPVNLPLLQGHINFESRILDFGCGYGRICRELERAGYKNVTGVDSSAEMIQRGRRQYPGLHLEALPASGPAYPRNAFDAIFLVAVLTCIPGDGGQRKLVHDLDAILRPGGIIYISDYLVQPDSRNVERYQKYAEKYGTYGVFELPEGAVVRHHSVEWMDELMHAYEKLDLSFLDVVTMNGNAAKAFQYLARKRG